MAGKDNNDLKDIRDANEMPIIGIFRVLKVLIVLSLLILSSSSCQRMKADFEPDVTYVPTASYIENMPSAFPKITKEEAPEDWSKEYRLGLGFVEEFDLYRAITCFKRARFLIPPKNIQRTQQIDFCLMQAYYIGGKWNEALYVFDHSGLIDAPADFPAMRELKIMLYDCFNKNNEPEKADLIRCSLVEIDLDLADSLTLSDVMIEGDVCMLEKLIPSSRRKAALCRFLNGFYSEAKSIRKAQTLNAILPGAGYLYVGQSKTAFTSFAINALFIAAAYQFFHNGYVAAGLITTSLEFGWYYGGINGAGLAAKEYNERLYECKAKDFMIQERLFPLLMFDYAF
jgi:hypothetical protein